MLDKNAWNHLTVCIQIYITYRPFNPIYIILALVSHLRYKALTHYVLWVLLFDLP